MTLRLFKTPPPFGKKPPPDDALRARLDRCDRSTVLGMVTHRVIEDRIAQIVHKIEGPVVAATTAEWAGNRDTRRGLTPKQRKQIRRATGIV